MHSIHCVLLSFFTHGSLSTNLPAVRTDWALSAFCLAPEATNAKTVWNSRKATMSRADPGFGHYCESLLILEFALCCQGVAIYPDLNKLFCPRVSHKESASQFVDLRLFKQRHPR